MTTQRILKVATLLVTISAIVMAVKIHRSIRLYRAVVSGNTPGLAELYSPGMLARDGLSTVEPVVLAIQHSQSESFLELERLGADLRAPCKNGFQPVHYAAEHADSKWISHLLKSGIDPDTQNPQAATSDVPLCWTVPDNRIDNARILIQYGADASIRDTFGMSVVELVIRAAKFEMAYMIVTTTTVMNDAEIARDVVRHMKDRPCASYSGVPGWSESCVKLRQWLIDKQFFQENQTNGLNQDR